MHFASAQRRFSGRWALSGARNVFFVYRNIPHALGSRQVYRLFFCDIPHGLAFVTFARSFCVQNTILLQMFLAADIASFAVVRFHKLRAFVAPFALFPLCGCIALLEHHVPAAPNLWRNA